jgi:hypothetical protein
MLSVGVGPSSGTTMSAGSQASESSGVPVESEAAAPEDGRTPAQSPSVVKRTTL